MVEMSSKTCYTYYGYFPMIKIDIKLLLALYLPYQGLLL